MGRCSSRLLTSPNHTCILWAGALILTSWFLQPQNRFFTNMASKDMGPSWPLVYNKRITINSLWICMPRRTTKQLWCLWWQGLEVTACKPELSPSRIVNYSNAWSLLLDQDGAHHCDDHCGEGQCTHRTCCHYIIPHNQWCQGVDSGPENAFEFYCFMVSPHLVTLSFASLRPRFTS